MGYERTFTVYHLTPEGWVAGDSTDDNPPTELGSPPHNRVETWLEQTESHDSGWGRPRRTWKQLWASDEYLEEQRKELRNKFRRVSVTDDVGTVRGWKEFPS